MMIARLAVNWVFLVALPFWILPALFLSIGRDVPKALARIMRGERWFWE